MPKVKVPVANPPVTKLLKSLSERSFFKVITTLGFEPTCHCGGSAVGQFGGNQGLIPLPGARPDGRAGGWGCFVRCLVGGWIGCNVI